jgi:hypothetical protein
VKHLWLTLIAASAIACSSKDDAAPAAPSGTDAAVETTPDVTADATPDVPGPDPVADKLVEFLVGDFDSSAQHQAAVAEGDPEKFLDITLSVCPIDAPEIGKRVLYVEQAVTSPYRPYRQRLYLIESEDGKGVSRIFELDKPSAFSGICKSASRPRVKPGDVTEKAGCKVTLAFDGKTFKGGTDGKSCPSTLNGATYTTSEIELDADKLRSLDRGYNDRDRQVWGSTNGPYVFLRKTAQADAGVDAATDADPVTDAATDADPITDAPADDADATPADAG